VEPSAARLRVAVAVTVAVQVVVFGGLALLAGWLSAQRSPSGRPDRLTLVAQGLLSTFALAATRGVGLPATLAGVWTNGAGLFCF
jgi:hypothetical protein